jgi:protein ImuA
MRSAVDMEIIDALQKQILTLQGIKTLETGQGQLGLGPIESAFPEKVFPRGAIHELVSFSPEEASSTNGFISVILGKLMREGGGCIWVSTRRTIYPPALKTFGIDPDRVLVIDAWRLKDALWTIEEALKCEAVQAVIGEIPELSFNDSRRLQLAVEKSRVTGFIHRNKPKQVNALACVSRWRVSPLPSGLNKSDTGVGFPKWNVELTRIRNGSPGKWILEWGPEGLEYITGEITRTKEYVRKIA